MAVVIKEADLVQSIADAVQFISYYHPQDYIQHLARAYEREQSPAAKDAIAQILTNSRIFTLKKSDQLIQRRAVYYQDQDNHDEHLHHRLLAMFC